MTSNKLISPEFWFSHPCIKKVRKELNKGFNPHSACEYGMTPLMYACLESNNINIVKLLIGRGCDVNAIDIHGLSVLSRYFCGGHKKQFKYVKLLVENGADVNYVKPDDGRSVLMMAMLSANEKCIKYLIQNGADVHHEDADGENVIDYKSILYYRTPEFIEWIKIQKIFK